MTFEGIGFVKSWLQKIALEQFLAEVEATASWWPGDANRMEKARTVYFLANPSQQNEGSAVTLPSIHTEEHGTDIDTTAAEPEQVQRRGSSRKRVQRDEPDVRGPEHEAAE